MKHTRPANTITHRARRAERTRSMEENRKAIIQLVSLIENATALKMIREIVTWIMDHQEDLI